MRHKAGHSWGWEDWWGWVSKRRPFKVILRGTHSMGPKSPASRESSYSENMHGKPRRWYTVWSGKVSKTHLISHLLVLGVNIFKVFIESVTTLLLLHVLVFWSRGTRDPNSLTKDRTRTPCIGRQSLNHWTAGEVPRAFVFKWRNLSPFQSSWFFSES